MVIGPLRLFNTRVGTPDEVQSLTFAFLDEVERGSVSPQLAGVLLTELGRLSEQVDPLGSAAWDPAWLSASREGPGASLWTFATGVQTRLTRAQFDVLERVLALRPDREGEDLPDLAELAQHCLGTVAGQ